MQIGPLKIQGYDVGDINNTPSGFISSDLGTLIGKVFGYVLGILAVVAVGFLVFAGYKYITSEGDSNKIKEAQNTITYAIIGLVIVLISGAIADFVVRIVTGKGLIDYALP